MQGTLLDLLSFRNPFPQVAEDVDAEINKYKADVTHITNSQGVNTLEELDPT